MFDINRIYSNYNDARFLCECAFPSENEAKIFVARHLMKVSETLFTAQLYNHGNVVIINTPAFNATKKIALILNKYIT